MRARRGAAERAASLGLVALLLAAGCGWHGWYSITDPNSWEVRSGELRAFRRDSDGCERRSRVGAGQGLDTRSFESCMQEYGWAPR